MGFFNRLSVDIEELLFDGATVKEIAQKLNLSVEQVNDYISQSEANYETDVYDLDIEVPTEI